MRGDRTCSLGVGGCIALNAVGGGSRVVVGGVAVVQRRSSRLVRTIWGVNVGGGIWRGRGLREHAASGLWMSCRECRGEVAGDPPHRCIIANCRIIQRYFHSRVIQHKNTHRT